MLYYEVIERMINEGCIETYVRHTDWEDLNLEIEGAKHLLFSKNGLFLITDDGLERISNETDLWDAIPKVDLHMGLDEPHICFSCLEEAREIVDLLEAKILKMCPNWGKPHPGRRK